jgi:hypothetical protein
MSLRFSGKAMAAELVVLSKVVGKFLDSGSSTRLQVLAKTLVLKTKDAVESGRQQFTWDTTEDGASRPLRTSDSTNYKGTTGNYKPLHAEITFEWTCKVEGPDQLRVSEGAIVVSILLGGSDQKTIHFDVCKGGYATGSGHPPFLVQFYGVVNDIPRFPMFIVSPVDVIDFVLLELFQQQWRSHLQTAKTRAQLRELPRQQRARSVNLLAKWRTSIEASPHVFVALQNEMPSPLEIC